MQCLPAAMRRQAAICGRLASGMPRAYGERAMLDVIFVAVTVAFFAVTIAYVKACERL